MWGQLKWHSTRLRSVKQSCTQLYLPGRWRSIPLWSAELHILHPGKLSICVQCTLQCTGHEKPSQYLDSCWSRSLSVEHRPSSTLCRPTLQQDTPTSLAPARDVERAGTMRWLSKHLETLLEARRVDMWQSWKLWILKWNSQVHFQRHLESNECVLGHELPYVCETCGKGTLASNYLSRI